MSIVLGLLALIALLVVLWLIALFNGLVRLRNLVREAWSGIDVQLKRRYDLIPNLVETVKGYAAHERQLFEKIAAYRNQSISATGVQEKGQAEQALTGALRSLFAVAEAYPDLKASQNFQDLQKSLSDVEEQLQLARRYYNGTVRELNTTVESFPAVVVAGAMGFKPAEYFQLESDAERATPRVAF